MDEQALSSGITMNNDFIFRTICLRLSSQMFVFLNNIMEIIL